MNLQAYLSERKVIVDKALDSCLPEPDGPARDIVSAMRYSLSAGGKRLRPILCMAGAEAVGGPEADTLPVACALELIHTYSLIHDDLPLMDDGDLRRGRPSSHKVFGDAVALLAGDGLLTEAFNLMTAAELTEKISPHVILKVIGIIAQAAGYRGMVGGQVLDIQSEGKTVDFPIVEFIHSHKTGALIAASVVSGSILGGGNESQIQAVTHYGRHVGLAFQISDDILDIEGNCRTMGKTVGVDEVDRKMTYPAVIGLSRSKEIQSELVETAVESLREFGHRAEPLRQIARYIIERQE
ncbi:MAG: farnesyl diphosphate synthase [Thermodesulfobacteriota bacterium]|nr:farnesyl diphosphate synthase [Thermodesulfobacteriota bacterium]